MSKKAKNTHFTVSGSIRERESGEGIPGMMVRVYDKDLLYDDLLGSAITDRAGSFRIYYSKADFSELFESRPDIYLVIYAPPYRRLIETKESIRWNASEHEEFTILIDRETLGELSPTRPSDLVEGGLSLDKDALSVQRYEGFDIPLLAGFINRGLAGAPSLPEQIQQIALPLEAQITAFEIDQGSSVALKGPYQLYPAQRPVPDVGTDPKQFGDGISFENSTIAFTPPNPKMYEGKQTPKHKLIEILGSVDIGPIQFVSVRVRPVQYDPTSKGLSFYPNLRYRARFETKAYPGGPAQDDDDGKVVAIPLHRAEYLEACLRSESVYMAAGLLNWWQIIPEEYPHVIITDNFAWPESIDVGGGVTRPPNIAERGAQLPGDVIEEFERLAKWKTQRGMRSRVVAISEIVGGLFGDFTDGGFARDLQEVIRNFIKHIYEEWGVTYVLLGGDVPVVPMRHLAGCSHYPSIGCYRFGFLAQGGTYRIPGEDAAKLWPIFQPAATDPLSTYHGGVVIPFDRTAGPNQIGWYFTTENDFKTLDTGFTRLAAGQVSRFIIVEGPANIIDDDYYWFRTVNSIPSDLYYASLTGAGYSVPGQHDFDSNDNGLYGQYHLHPEMGIEWPLEGLVKFDISVGRASVESGAEAQNFVDKVISYERQEEPNGNRIDSSYLKKVLYAAHAWSRSTHGRQGNTANPPRPGTFTHVIGTQSTKITLHDDFGVRFIKGTIVPEYRLFARHADRDDRISYSIASGNQPVWRFTTDDTFGVESATPTKFVLVEGPEAQVDPISFFWDPLGVELATEQKERLRLEMNDLFPVFNSVQRFYYDYFTPISSPPHVEPIRQEPLLAALDAGVHFLSLSGHGSPNGCCLIGTDHNFANENEYFVAFAFSCSTARPDYPFDSLAEIMTIAPKSGAVAYVGNTRYGWIGTGIWYEEAFWKGLDLTGRLGPAVGSRWQLGLIDTWTFYAENLFGDPEMPVWTSFPFEFAVGHPSDPGNPLTHVTWGDSFSVVVVVPQVGAPINGARVTVMGGWTKSSIRPRVLISKVTEATGVASFQLPSSSPALDELTVTVTKQNCKPYIGKIRILAN